MKIKVCGMRDSDNIREVASQIVPDMMGFIFYPPSSRFAIPDLSPDVILNLHKSILPIGVFVDMPRADVEEIARQYHLRGIQCHGHETPEDCLYFRKKSYFTLKAFGICDASDFEMSSAYLDSVDAFVFDAKTPLYGGSGQQYDWSVLSYYQANTPFLLSGGIGPDDVSSILKFSHPSFWGIDLNSRFESSPGIKDLNLLRPFVDNIRITSKISSSYESN